MDMRHLMRIVESTLHEGRSLRLSNGRRAIEAPTRSDIIQMLARVPMLRGVVLEHETGPMAYVWSGLTMAHDIGLYRIRDEIGIDPEFLAWFKIGATPDAIHEDRYWRDEEAIDCGGYYAAVSKMGGGEEDRAKAMTLPIFRRSDAR